MSREAPTLLQQWLIANVREGMRDCGMDQAQLAREAAVSEKHLSQLLSGRAVGSIPLWDWLLLLVGVRHHTLQFSDVSGGGGS